MEDISSLDIKQAFLMLAEEKDGDYKDIEEVYGKARFGIQKRFDIYDYIYDLMSFSKVKSGKVIYRGVTIKLTEFWTEIEERNNLIKKWLRDNLEPDSLAQGFEVK